MRAYVDADGLIHAFLMAGTNFTSFEFPGATSSLAWGVNSAGQVVGVYRNADGIPHGFLAQPNNKA